LYCLVTKRSKKQTTEITSQHRVGNASSVAVCVTAVLALLLFVIVSNS